MTTSKTPRKKGIYLLPNLLTIGGLFSGFYAMVAALQHHYTTAAVAILIAMVLDGLDGRVARLTNSQSAFGAELDSLCDIVSFGVAPALVMYTWSLEHLAQLGWDKLGWLAAFLYVACTALRLAKFNTRAQAGTGSKRYFSGLPCPAAAAVIACVVWVGNIYHVSGDVLSVAGVVVTLFLAWLMVSNMRYHTFKEIDLKGHVPFTAVLLVLLVYAFISWRPAHVLFAFFVLYALSGPVLTGIYRVRKWRKHSRKKRAARDAK
jgi:CDP-diacylglycerol--serine O-phosphatidyltransferase